MSEAKDVKKTAVPDVALELIEALNKKVNDLEAKMRKHTANWKRYVERYVDLTGGGKIGGAKVGAMVLVLAMATGLFAFNQNSVQRPEDDSLNTYEFDSDGTLTIVANEATDAEIILKADQGDDNPDIGKWYIDATDSDTLKYATFSSGAYVDIFELTTGGALTTTSLEAGVTNYGGGITADVEITLTDTDGQATITATAFTGSDAVFVLDANAGAVNADTWFIESESTGNDLSFVNHVSEVLNLTSAGALTAVAGVSAGDAVTLTDADGAAIISAIGLTGDFDATLVLDADGGDDPADTWIIESEGADNDLSFVQHATEEFKIDSDGDAFITGDLDIKGDGLNCDGDLLITPAGNDVLIDGGLTVGASGDPGDNNLIVDGTALVTGVGTFSAQDIHNGGIQVNEDVDINLDATDEEVSIVQTADAGGAGLALVTIQNTVADTTVQGYLLRLIRTDNADADGDFFIAEDNNGDDLFTIAQDGDTAIAGTLGVTGVGTFTAQSVHTAGVNADGDIDIDFSANTEEMRIDTAVNPDVAAGAGMVTLYDAEDANGANSAYLLRLASKNNGGANNEFILCEDNSDGTAASGDTMFEVAAGGNVTVAGTLGVTGVGTFTAQSIHTGGINADADIDIDFSANTEEMVVTTAVNPDVAAGGGMVTLYDSEDANSANSAYLLRMARKNDGGANNEFILCEDNSTGVAGNGDTMFEVDAIGGVTMAADLTVVGSDIILNAAGVKLSSDNDGALTILSLGDSNTEDLTLNLDDTADEVTVTSSTGVGTLNLSGIALETPMVRPLASNVTTTDTLTFDEGTIFTVDSTGGAVALTLPDAADVLGATYKILFVTDNGDLTILRAGTDVFNSSNHTLLTAADAEDFIIITAVSANRWLIESNTGFTAS